MVSSEDVIRIQAEHHPLAWVDGFATNEDYCLYLIHMRAYIEAARLAKGRAVLDLGCNCGYGTAVIGRESKSVVGIDVSDQAIAEAVSRHQSENVTFRVVDGKRLPFEDGTFDLVTSLQVIEHINDLGSYLSEVGRVLSGGGIAVFTTPNAVLRLDPGMPPWNPFHVREFTPDELKATLTPWFGTVQVAGLFGIAELHETELRRLLASREGARKRAAARSPSLRMRAAVRRLLRGTQAGVVVRRLRDEAKKWIAQRRTREPGAAKDVVDPAFVSRYGPMDFYYGTDRLEEALDLMATCTKS
jgi:SAM-dependent methyltransferase